MKQQLLEEQQQEAAAVLHHALLLGPQLPEEEEEVAVHQQLKLAEEQQEVAEYLSEQLQLVGPGTQSQHQSLSAWEVHQQLWGAKVNPNCDHQPTNYHCSYHHVENRVHA